MVNDAANAVTPRRQTVRRCVHCGATDGLVRRMEYIGGLGYVPRIRCANEVECWARFDRQHNLRPVVR